MITTLGPVSVQCWRISAGGHWNKDGQMPVLISSMALYMGLWQVPGQNISRPKLGFHEIATQ